MISSGGVCASLRLPLKTSISLGLNLTVLVGGYSPCDDSRGWAQVERVWWSLCLVALAPMDIGQSLSQCFSFYQVFRSEENTYHVISVEGGPRLKSFGGVCASLRLPHPTCVLGGPKLMSSGGEVDSVESRFQIMVEPGWPISISSGGVPPMEKLCACWVSKPKLYSMADRTG